MMVFNFGILVKWNILYGKTEAQMWELPAQKYASYDHRNGITEDSRSGRSFEQDSCNSIQD